MIVDMENCNYDNLEMRRKSHQFDVATVRVVAEYHLLQRTYVLFPLAIMCVSNVKVGLPVDCHIDFLNVSYPLLRIEFVDKMAALSGDYYCTNLEPLIM